MQPDKKPQPFPNAVYVIVQAVNIIPGKQKLQEMPKDVCQT